MYIDPSVYEDEFLDDEETDFFVKKTSSHKKQKTQNKQTNKTLFDRNAKKNKRNVSKLKKNALQLSLKENNILLFREHK